MSVPLAAVAVSALVLQGSFHRVEQVLLVLATAFAAYLVAAVLAKPDWGAAAHGLVVPSMPLDRDALLTVTAVVGTTLAPWGLSFIQSYAVDKRLTPSDLRAERIDVVTGAIMTGVIGLFVVVACAATLHASGDSIVDARDAAAALEPLAGGLASALFGAGLVGAAMLAASVLPLSTAYSVAEALGREATLDDSFGEAPVFYCSVRRSGRRRRGCRADPRCPARADPRPHPGAQRRPAPAAAGAARPGSPRDPVLMGELSQQPRRGGAPSAHDRAPRRLRRGPARAPLLMAPAAGRRRRP